MEERDLDAGVRGVVYDRVMTTARVPTREEIAREMGLAGEVVGEALERLAAARALVLQPESRQVLMANPFSAVPTPFVAHTNGRDYFANCIWDGLGILAMLGTDGRVDTTCGCCGEAMSLAVSEDELAPGSGVVHFAVPARRWWEDIVYN